MSTSAASSSSALQPYDLPEKEDEFVPQGPSPTHAYGIVMDDHCLRRRAAVLYQELYGEDPAKTLSPKAARKALDDLRPLALSTIPSDVYLEVPGLPQYKRNIILLNDSRGLWLLVFKDNSSRAALRAPLDPEDVKKAKRFLGLQWQSAKWYRVPVE